MLRVWLIGLSTAAVICGVVALGLSKAHSAEACVPVDALKKSLIEQGAPADAIVTLLGATQVNLYAQAVGLVLTDSMRATALLFVTTPTDVIVSVIEGDCTRYYFRVPTALHRRAIGAIMRGA